MNCKKCGSSIPDGISVCVICGEPVPTEPAKVEEPKVEEVKMEVPVPKEEPVVAPEVPKPDPAPVAPSPVAAPEPPKPEPAPVAPSPVAAPEPPKPAAAPVAPATPEPPKKDNKVFILICIALLAVIVVLVVLILNKDNDSESKDSKEETKTTEKTSTSTTTSVPSSSTTTTTTTTAISSGQYIDYKGMQVYVPDGFETNIDGNQIQFMSTSKQQVLVLEIESYDYTTLANNFDEFIKNMEASGFTTESKEQTQYNGVKYSVLRGKMMGENMATGYADFGSNKSAIFAFQLSTATETEYVKTMTDIIKNCKNTSSFTG